MGRPFSRELHDLESTYHYSLTGFCADIEMMVEFLLSSPDKPIIVVGSGGSFSVAKAFEGICSAAKYESLVRAVTPLEFYELHSVVHNSKVLIISSNGNNNDIVSIYKFANRCIPVALLVLCLNHHSKLKMLTKDSSHPFIGHRLPRGKDGFLAVNSTIAFIAIITQAFYKITKMEEFHVTTEFNKLAASEGLGDFSEQLNDSIIVLHSDYATPVAVDLESKFSETALGNIMQADYRSFAHGRHFWLSKRKSSTSVLFLVTPTNKHVFSKTIDLIPPDVHRIVLKTMHRGVQGMLDLLLQSFKLVEAVGYRMGIDPGKPTVPTFGRLLYNSTYMIKQSQIARQNDTVIGRSVFRKAGCFDSVIFLRFKDAFERFRKLMHSTEFHEAVFDYDSTIHDRGTDTEIENEIYTHLISMLKNNIPIKIATGRGKSVRTELREKIPEEFWNRVFIGYYNGSIVLKLNDSRDLLALLEQNPYLLQISKDFDVCFPELEYELRPTQISILMNEFKNLAYRKLIIEKMGKYPMLKFFFSGHSLDIVPTEISKLNVLSNKNINSLCMGDSGQLGGNDYELLSTAYSLSVNRVSTSFSSCWNYAPLELKESKATLYYLRRISLGRGKFSIRIN